MSENVSEYLHLNDCLCTIGDVEGSVSVATFFDPHLSVDSLLEGIDMSGVPIV